MSKKKKQKDVKSRQAQKKREDFTIKDYALINLFFWGFLVLLAIVIYFTTGAKMDPVIASVFKFIFLVFGLGFTFVSVFDYFYDKTAKKNENK